MTEDPGETGKPRYPANNWGSMAADPLRDITPVTPAWRAAIERIWFRNGGTQADFDALFGDSLGPPTPPPTSS